MGERKRGTLATRRVAIRVGLVAALLACAFAATAAAARTLATGPEAPTYFPVFVQQAAGQFASGGWQDFIYDTATGKRTKVLPPECNAMSFSPSGDRALALCTATTINGQSQGLSGLYVIYPSKRKPLRLVPYTVPKQVLGGVFSPDARTVVYVQTPASGNGVAQHLFRMPASGGKAKQLTFGAASDADPTFTPNGRWILFDRTNATTDNSTIFAIPARGGAPHLVGVASSLLVGGVSPDGSTLLWRDGYSLHAQSFDQASATVTDATPDHALLDDVSGGGGLWSPGGSEIGYGRQLNLNGQTAPHAAVANADGSDQRTISHDPSGHTSIVLAWLPAEAAARWGG